MVLSDSSPRLCRLNTEFSVSRPLSEGAPSSPPPPPPTQLLPPTSPEPVVRMDRRRSEGRKANLVNSRDKTIEQTVNKNAPSVVVIRRYLHFSRVAFVANVAAFVVVAVAIVVVAVVVVVIVVVRESRDLFAGRPSVGPVQQTVGAAAAAEESTADPRSHRQSSKPTSGRLQSDRYYLVGRKS